jgi:hypothetical protein
MPDTLWVETTTPCADPECAEQGGVGEPDGDATIRYFVCGRCEREYGYVQVKQQDACQLGVPEGVRRLAPNQATEPVLLQIGRRPPDA